MVSARASSWFVLNLTVAVSGFSLQMPKRRTSAPKQVLRVPMTRWAALNLPNDFEIFLNQCAIQSFAFLLRSLRDPQTVLWLERFTQPAIADFNSTSTASYQSPLLTYHGLAGLNLTLFPSWDVYFGKLLEMPAETLTIESHSPHIRDYDLEIVPASICSRILSVREHIAREFVRDLSVIEHMGVHSLDSYWTTLKERSVDESMLRIQRENLLFLDLAAEHNSDVDPTPLRKGNFDLLVLLATQESIHRVLQKTPHRLVGQASYQFLRTFYADRLLSHFVGAKRYGRADDFVEELLAEPPRMIRTEEDDTHHLIDPMRIAEVILEEREAVARDWKAVALEVPQKHMSIKRMQLNLLLGIPANRTVFQ